MISKPIDIFLIAFDIQIAFDIFVERIHNIIYSNENKL